ncbi:MAG: PIN domain nuclease [Flavobacteriaceae bacterium]|jgi:predicted nucleic acid-binding protein|nr:PIN domain nuclease [Flavobacteriaceae bacterium]
MIVITDTNIFYSALQKPSGIIAKILTAKSKIQFFAPDFLIDEIRDKIDEIVDNTKKSRKEKLNELTMLLAKISIINMEDIPKKDVVQAYKIVRDIDLEDLAFVALHLYTKHKIWTTDIQLQNGLKAKGYDICITTTELKKSLYKK